MRYLPNKLRPWSGSAPFMICARAGLLLTERRWNRTIQPEGCSGLPVLKIGVVVTQGSRVVTTLATFRTEGCGTPVHHHPVDAKREHCRAGGHASVLLFTRKRR